LFHLCAHHEREPAHRGREHLDVGTIDLARERQGFLGEPRALGCILSADQSETCLPGAQSRMVRRWRQRLEQTSGILEPTIGNGRIAAKVEKIVAERDGHVCGRDIVAGLAVQAIRREPGIDHHPRVLLQPCRLGKASPCFGGVRLSR
jgi:hypothetical protein